MVGDPSGKAKKDMLGEDELNRNVLGIKKQLQQLPEFRPFPRQCC